MCWWDHNIAKLRPECLRLQRRYTRAKSDEPAADEILAYKQAKKSLKKVTTRKKNQAFQPPRDYVNENTFGLGYKIVMDDLNGMKQMDIMDEQVMRNIVDALFSIHELNVKFLPYSAEELKVAAVGKKSVKHTGLASQRPELLLGIYNAWLRECSFLEIWKKQWLGKRNSENPSAYREAALGAFKATAYCCY